MMILSGRGAPTLHRATLAARGARQRRLYESARGLADHAAAVRPRPHWAVQPTLSERGEKYAARYASAAPVPPGRPAIRREDYALPNVHEAERGAFAFVLRGVYTPEECAAMLVASEARGYEEALVNTGRSQVLDKSTRHSARNMWDSRDTARELFARIESHLPSGEPRSFGYAIPPKPLVCEGLNERLRFLRYGPGHFFAKHRDGSFAKHRDGSYRLRNDGSSQSYLTLMLYLNSSGAGADYEGGETCFVLDTEHARESPCGRHGAAAPDVVHTPQAGDVLIFAHPVLHQGNEVVSGTKYAVRTDVMYSDPTFSA